MTRTASLSLSVLLSSAATLVFATAVQAQTTEGTAVSAVTVTAERAVRSYQPAVEAAVGPLGPQVLADTPAAITVVPSDLILNLQSKTVNDTLRYLPSVQVRDQQGYEVSRPQARGFQGSVAQNTRVDGLSIVGTSATAAEMLDSGEVMNGLSGALYGPATPAGVFNYQLKRPTERPMLAFTESYDSNSVFTEHLDTGGRFGPGDRFGLRLNLAKGDGETWTDYSAEHRTLAGVAADYRFDAKTVLELNYVYYDTNITGLPGSIVYDGVSSHSGTSSVLPIGLDPTRAGYGQSGAGADLTTNLGSFKVKRQLSDSWSFEFGGLYQGAVRNLFGITNTLTNDAGAYTVTKNFTAVPHFTIGSNEAYLNGHVMFAGMMNDITLGTNGFINGQYNYRNSIATTLGTGTLANPTILPGKPEPATGGQYHSGSLCNQTLFFGDTVHLTPRLAIQGVFNDAWFSSRSWSKTGAVTSSNTQNGAVSGTASLIYKPVDKVTAYFTYSNSIEQGEAAGANTANASQFLAPYHDVMYEAGVKYAPSDRLLITLDGFRMTRPFAQTNPGNNLFEVIGEQRNTGFELFVQGAVTRDLSLFGGATYIEAKLFGSVLPSVNNKWVVGVPEFKGDLAADYHPAVLQRVALTAAIHAESQRAATNVNNSFAPAYTTFDLGARYTLPVAGKPTTLRLQVLNISNVRYYSSIADGSIVGSPGANTAYMAQPRTIQASVAVSFF